MIGILVASHGGFAQSLLESAEMIFGPAENVRTIGLYPADDVCTFYKKIVELVRELDDGDGVLTLVDLKGGSPCNQAIMALREVSFSCLTGVNLPMLIEALNGRCFMNLKELSESCAAIACEGVTDISLELLKQ